MPSTPHGGMLASTGREKLGPFTMNWEALALIVRLSSSRIVRSAVENLRLLVASEVCGGGTGGAGASLGLGVVAVGGGDWGMVVSGSEETIRGLVTMMDRGSGRGGLEGVLLLVV